MNKVAIVLLADNEDHEDLARMTNALQAVREFQDHGDDVKLIFDGAGTQWVHTLSDPDHDAHSLFKIVEESITGVCDFCAEAFEVHEEIDEKYDMLDEYHRHPSFRDLVTNGYQVITF